jgi:quercetin dioxygenase-like cupin family protein
MPYIMLEDLNESQPIPGYRGRFVHSDNMTVANWTIEEGSAFPNHSHPQEQISIVAEGRFELTIEEETEILCPGLVAVIPPGAPHSGRALTDCRVIDIFHPVREDYR